MKRPIRGERSVSPEKKFSALTKLLEGKNYKQVAHEEKLCFSSVYLVKNSFPLFFWKKDDPNA